MNAYATSHSFPSIEKNSVKGQEAQTNSYLWSVREHLISEGAKN
jgi:hypothetical protein